MQLFQTRYETFLTFENTDVKSLVVSLCMSGVLRPDFEVVKEGRILHFVSGYRRFVISDRIIQGVAVLIAIGTIPAEPTLKKQPFISFPL